MRAKAEKRSPRLRHLHAKTTDLIGSKEPVSMSNNTQRKVIIMGSIEPAEKRR